MERQGNVGHTLIYIAPYDIRKHEFTHKKQI